MNKIILKVLKKNLYVIANAKYTKRNSKYKDFWLVFEQRQFTTSIIVSLTTL